MDNVNKTAAINYICKPTLLYNTCSNEKIKNNTDNNGEFCQNVLYCLNYVFLCQLEMSIKNIFIKNCLFQD